MIDREIVIEGLEMSYRYSNVDEGNTLVPQQLVLDALALLKSYAEADLIDRQSLWEHMNNLLPEPGASMMIWSKDVLAVIEEEEQWH